MPQIYVDQDGVLADFDAHYFAIFGVQASKLTDNVDWAAVKAAPNFYRDIPPMDDMKALWNYIVHLDPIILTGIPKSITAAPKNKRDWVAYHVGKDARIVTCLSHEKWTYCKPGDILIDDWDRYKDRWEKAGGIWITHTSAADTINQLKALGI
jgi:hypothetical protein